MVNLDEDGKKFTTPEYKPSTPETHTHTYRWNLLR